MNPFPRVYTTNHVHSKVVCGAFSEGCDGKIVPPGRLQEGPAVVYGILRGCGEVIKQCAWVGRDFYHIDHGYFCRGHYEGYYRVSRNSLQCDGFGDFTPKRWEELGLSLRPWRRMGRNVVICPISSMVAQFLGIDHEKWLETVISEISLHTDRPITVKYKDGTSLSEALKNAWCVVTHSSNAAVDAITNGIPAITLGNSSCGPVSWDFSTIESPEWPEREQWAWTLANWQFTLEEMRSGYAWDCVSGR